MPCNYKRLYVCPNGYVLYCHACDQLRIAFGTSLLAFPLDAFSPFLMQVQLLAEERGEDAPNYKNVLLPTPVKHTTMILSPAELSSLSLMLDAADSELKALELVEMFNES